MPQSLSLPHTLILGLSTPGNPMYPLGGVSPPHTHAYMDAILATHGKPMYPGGWGGDPPSHPPGYMGLPEGCQDCLRTPSHVYWFMPQSLSLPHTLILVLSTPGNPMYPLGGEGPPPTHMGTWTRLWQPMADLCTRVGGGGEPPPPIRVHGAS